MFLIRVLPVPVGSIQHEGGPSKARLINGILKGKLAEKDKRLRLMNGENAFNLNSDIPKKALPKEGGNCWF